MNSKLVKPFSSGYLNRRCVVLLLVFGVVSLVSGAGCFDPHKIDERTVRSPKEGKGGDTDGNGQHNGTDGETTVLVPDGKKKPGRDPEEGGGDSQQDGNNHNDEKEKSEWDTPSSPYRPAWSGVEGVRTVTCGDGVIDGNEQCDDGNRKSGDGCSSSCVKELSRYEGVWESCRQPWDKDDWYVSFVTKVRTKNTLPVTCLTAPDIEVERLLDEDGYPLLSSCKTEFNENFKRWFREVPAAQADNESDASGEAEEIYYLTTKKKTGNISLEDYPLGHSLVNWIHPNKTSMNKGSAAPYFLRIARIPFKYQGEESLHFAVQGGLLIFINGIKAYENSGAKSGFSKWINLDVSIDAEVDSTTNKKVSKKYHMKEGGLYELSIFHFGFDGQGKNLAISIPDYVVGASLCQVCGDGRVFSFAPSETKDGLMVPPERGYRSDGKLDREQEECEPSFSVGSDYCDSQCKVLRDRDLSWKRKACFMRYDRSSYCKEVANL